MTRQLGVYCWGFSTQGSLVETSATLVVTGALLVVTRSYSLIQNTHKSKHGDCSNQTNKDKVYDPKAIEQMNFTCWLTHTCNYIRPPQLSLLLGPPGNP